MPAKPRWLLAVPDAIAQLQTLERELLVRPDIETLFGVGKARAATLMRAWGAERTGNVRTLARTALLKRLKAKRLTSAVGEERTRRQQVADTLRQARLTGLRFRVTPEALTARLDGLPAGVTVEPGRIEVRFDGARDAVTRLFALAQALTHDYERFERLVGGAAQTPPHDAGPQVRERHTRGESGR